MRNYLFCVLAFLFVNVHIDYAQRCGCKTVRPCYETMLQTLMDRDETACIEDAAIGTSTILVFLSALNQYCSEIVAVHHQHLTFEGRYLYEVVIDKNKSTEVDKDKPVIILEAGQQGGSTPVAFALYVVEQLVACLEYQHMAENVRWVIMPSSNPDGLEYSRYSPSLWKKNLRPTEDELSFGVDISRNFDSQWASCPRPDTSFSAIYPGSKPGSENETVFIKEVITKYKENTKIYVSLRRDGHSILFPHGYTQTHPASIKMLTKVASEVTVRVNQRAVGVYLFTNESIYDSEGKPYCGNSVDYALDSGIPLSFEMRVFLGSETRIMSMFQSLPRGYETSLRNGYFSAIREFYNVVTNEKKYGKII